MKFSKSSKYKAVRVRRKGSKGRKGAMTTVYKLRKPAKRKSRK